MSKYKIEFKQSRLLVVFQLLSYVVLVMSILNWQFDVYEYQVLLQLLIIFIISFLVFRTVFYSKGQAKTSAIISHSGEWLETHVDGQIGWKITDRSRVSSLLLFIHLISPVNARHSKWYLIYKDEVTDQDFRRICRAILYQQQNAGEN